MRNVKLAIYRNKAFSYFIYFISVNVCFMSRNILLFILDLVTFTFMHLADAFIQSDLHSLSIQAIHFFVSTCVSWESNPQPLRC